MIDNIATKDRGKHFSFLVRQAITNSERHQIATVAAGTGMSYHAFYQRLEGKTPFSADEIRRIIACFPEPSLVSYLLKDTAYVAAERIDAERSDEEEAIYQAAHRIVFEASDVLKVVDIALRDHRIDHRDITSITKEIEDAERSLISLREYVSTLK
ncbi:phage regulatory CII family protein [Cohaesibacter celericrescens]|uniref:Uncharacterized protein n=1 Tax=Cohaesibacter celericrescens TaxID=2067669 RepID=A0A2N5XKQ1_9HYPH|nr:phage regulatory CII family protein [Cohaesibacter celericrescens]PLW75018.1 hypothetical protein C0081_22220 [Cohaesibacter celericrescens]